MDKDNNVVEEVAKSMIKKKIMAIVLSSLSVALPFFLSFFVIFT